MTPDTFFQLLRADEQFRPLDAALARFFREKGGEQHPLVLFAAALASQAVSFGHTCLDLASCVEQAITQPLHSVFSLLRQTDTEHWKETLRHSVLVDDYTRKTPVPKDNAPLVLENNLLYLRRYWQYETDIAASVAARTAMRREIAPAQLAPLFEQIFPDKQVETNWQKIACALALTSPFSIITGGPGTGKTTTVVRLLALTQALALQEGKQPLQVALAAPTGKAAARLQEAIQKQLVTLPPAAGRPWEELLLPNARTLHRLLGARAMERTFAQNEQHPLEYDVIVVDEASMLDLELLHALLMATPLSSALILLGDQNQLASIEAGYVLGSLCARAQTGHYSPQTRNWLQAVCGETIPKEFEDKTGSFLDQSTVLLRKSYRFGEASGIGQAANLIQTKTNCRAADLLELFRRSSDDLFLVRLSGAQDRILPDFVLERYALYIEQLKHIPQPEHIDRWALSLLRELQAFQLLTPLRNGPWGVNELNELLTTAFQKKAGVRQGQWFHGRPVLVTRNQPHLGLMNGDRGLTLMHENGNLRVVFASEDGQLRWLAPMRLETVETAFAMTVHKAQGSEFAGCALLMPQTPAQVLSRELLYTAITRAKEHFSLFISDQSVLDFALRRRLVRTSGLAQKIEDLTVSGCRKNGEKQ